MGETGPIVVADVCNRLGGACEFLPRRVRVRVHVYLEGEVECD
jgi:hypothetical protein